MKKTKFKTIRASELSHLRMVAGNEKKYSKIVDSAGRVLEWVGIGWIDLGDAKSPEHDKLPRIK